MLAHVDQEKECEVRKNTMKKRWLKLSGMLVATLLWGFSGFSASGIGVRAEAKQNPNAGEGEVRVLPVRDNIYMVTGAGSNITVQVGQDGLLLVDTGRASMSNEVLAAIREFSDAPIRQIILTHDHEDTLGGVPTLRFAGDAILGGNFSGRAGAAIFTHEKAFLRIVSATLESLPYETTPTDSYFRDRHEFYFNGEAVEILHQPQAHTDADSIVFFRRSDVISTGDIIDTTRYPVIDEERGGSINGVIAALNKITEIAVSRYLEEDGTLVIPGRGRLMDQGDLSYYRYMVTMVRDRIEDLVEKGMTLEQVKAARPTLDYDARYGSDTGPWTTEMFIEAMYRGVGRSE